MTHLQPLSRAAQDDARQELARVLAELAEQLQAVTMTAAELARVAQLARELEQLVGVAVALQPLRKLLELI